jgi:hypothetical protein
MGAREKQSDHLSRRNGRRPSANPSAAPTVTASGLDGGERAALQLGRSRSHRKRSRGHLLFRCAPHPLRSSLLPLLPIQRSSSVG